MSTKLCIEFGPDQSEALGKLADQLDTTKAGVIRSAVALLHIAVREARRGNAVGVIQGERVVKEIAGVWSAAEPVGAAA